MRNPGGNLMASHKRRRGVARDLAIGAQPAVVGRIHLRLEHGVGNALRQIDGGEHDLLDDFAGLVAELGLERHGSLLVDPQPVAVAIFVARMQRDHARGAAEQAFAFAATDFVDLRAGIVDGRQRAEQRPIGSATLDQHGALVGEITGEFVAFANEFAARAIERQQALGHIAPAHAVDDAQGFDAAAVHVGEHAHVVARGQRLVHALEPLFRFGAEGNARAQQQRQRREARAILLLMPIRASDESGRITAHLRLLRPASGYSARPGCRDLGRVGGHEAEQRHAARQRTGIFAVRHHVVREPRRRRDAG